MNSWKEQHMLEEILNSVQQTVSITLLNLALKQGYVQEVLKNQKHSAETHQLVPEKEYNLY